MNIAAANGLQSGNKIDTRRLDCGSKPEQNAGDQREKQRDSERRPVQLSTNKVGTSVRQQQREKANTPPGHRNTGNATRERQQYALGEQLSNHTRATGPDA